MGGNDTLALLPTGGGKSICYQLPAIAMEGIGIVISPLIALMKDQVSQLRKRHIPAACIISGMHGSEIEAVLNNCVFGKIKLLYVSPERLQSRIFIDHFRQMHVNLIAVDEAHCISQWGYDFRPPYLEVARIRQYHPQAPVIALTATATPDVVTDIMEKMEMRHGKLFQGSYIREKLSYSVRKTDDKQGLMLNIIKKVGGSGIVYVRSRRRTVELARMLNDNDIPAAAYHAGISMKERDQRQKDWQSSKCGVMVATNAFGMGIDKADVRFVVHLDFPESPEAYFQEAGRAGRDGQRAYAVLAYNDGDIERLKEGVEKDYPPINYIKNVYRAICNYYQIPVGSGQESRFDFDLEGITTSYGLDPYTVFSSLKFLEREGLISLPEHNELQSRLLFTIGKEELYRFQVANRLIGDMITTILRLYGGLFTDYSHISESHIAKRCGMTELQVANNLTELNRLGIAVYIPKTTKPQIVFCSPRIDIKDLHISDRNYKELKSAAVQRREAIIEYATGNDICRSRWLLRYFGEESGADCGCCDVCLAKKKKPEKASEQTIAEILAKDKLTIKQLCEALPIYDKEETVSTVRRMLDKGSLTMDEDFKLGVSGRSTP